MLTTKFNNLTPEEKRVIEEKGTEAPFTGEYDNFFPADGVFVCRKCNNPLFSAKAKFDSGCGWPAFSKPIENVTEHADFSHGMRRVEVRSKHANSHLGHVFTDGPQSDGGLRYCINSAALRFIPLLEMERQGYADYIKYVEVNT